MEQGLYNQVNQHGECFKMIIDLVYNLFMLEMCLKDIKKHQELWIDYGYTVNDNAPQWYLDTHKKEVGPIPRE